MAATIPVLTRMRSGFVLALVAQLTACSLPVVKTGAGIALPARWQSASSVDAAGVNAQWWQSFGSAELTALVEAAQQDSFDVAAAVARVRQADALVRVSGASLLPQIDAGVSVERTREVGYPMYNDYSGYFTASYELDLWGANRATRQAAIDTLGARRAERDAVALTLTADFANTWLQVLALRERAAIARQDLAAGERLLGFVESQYRAGAATVSNVAQQKTLVAQLTQSVAQYGQQAQYSRIALATLAGKPPQGFQVAGDSLDGLTIPVIGAGVPADLLTRRPDIAEAERKLAAADADVTVARAAMLPAVTLTADAGAGNTRLANLLEHPIYDLVAGLSAPIFHGGALAASRDLALAQREELLADYRASIVSALGDVESALNAIDGIMTRQRAQADVLDQAQIALQQVESRYRAGAQTLQTLLDAQRTLYAAKDEALQLKLARLQAAVALYKALGGGWDVKQENGVTSVAPATRAAAQAQFERGQPGWAISSTTIDGNS
ncbi:NodT family efflux transporter outer membrane factor (OMF) lipoprotein [Paraburkholderia eburnea]|uniref:NodT family efflux transporter outer membrane factor (OMF) lipoprotein n=2 Tax=Paraburkholderia eburnea TaxID=1189126 RepID=A0A2S4LV49_9BURK|nr:NodT family efflux transporter outer membrane factor (OMF) lipoprotein [Paraburkholderia eburnea]PRZ16257.1 NodT family efflux transporter outer membrane factor (OMF) lipoprotein [Paraburkholderia eburnea]